MLSHNASLCPSSSGNAPLLSFSDVLARVMLQVEYHCFADLRSGFIDPLYKELCFIIAEVLVLDPVVVIKVNGIQLPISLVHDIYAQLRNEHLRLVFSNFCDVSSRVFNKKAYLRSSLYNSVFEIVSQDVNQAFDI